MPGHFPTVGAWLSIGYYDNDYPCIMVSMLHLLTLDKKYDTEWQQLLLAYFIAIVNDNAYQANVPIEIVRRSGFAHNLTTVDITGSTFRISIGIIPKIYAFILGKSLINLYQLFRRLTQGPHIKIEKEYIDQKEQELSIYFKSNNTTNTKKNPVCRDLLGDLRIS